MLMEVLKNFEYYRKNKIKQNPALATKTGLINKCDGVINWNEDAALISRKIRAYNPWPGACTKFNGKSVKILKAESIQKSCEGCSPGTVIEIDPKNGIIISCGSNALLIKQVQPENKRPISAADFINGYRLKLGDRFD
ncbi:MAG TPA: hypothetical protein ENN73_03225 [Firmicutes bacterium]|nr:hypothetical protein [Bacillota bacterium]